jgi:hypothetical protein
LTGWTGFANGLHLPHDFILFIPLILSDSRSSPMREIFILAVFDRSRRDLVRIPRHAGLKTEVANTGKYRQ